MFLIRYYFVFLSLSLHSIFFFILLLLLLLPLLLLFPPLPLLLLYGGEVKASGCPDRLGVWMCVGVCECGPDRKPHLLSFSYLFLFGAATTTIIIAAASAAAAATHYDATAAAASVGGFVWLRFYLLSRQLIDWLLYSTWLLNDL